MPRHRYRTSDTIGKIGASAFRSWAEAVGLVVNESADDQAGWDFIVESNPEAAHEPPADPFGHADSFPVRARVQVKATDKRDGAIDMKLSNWVRLVESPDPAFVFVAELDGEGVPQRAWLYHVGEDDWRDVERRKWENETGHGKKAKRPLHKLSRRLRYGAHDALPSLDGGALLDAMADAVGPSPSEYASRKMTVVREAGYERGNATVRLRIGGDAPPDVSLAEAQLGLRPRVRVRDVHVAPTRFGVTHEGRVHVVGDAELFVQTAATGVPVEVELEAGGDVARVPVTLHVPHAFTHRLASGQDPEGLSLRARSPELDLVIRFGRASSLNLSSPASDHPTPLRSLLVLSRATRVMGSAARNGVPLDIRIVGPDGVALKLKQDPVPPSEGGINIDDFPPDWLLDGVEDAWHIARAFEAENEVVTTIDEIAESALGLSQLRSITDGSADGAYRFEWEPGAEGEGPQRLTELSEAVIVAYHAALGATRFSVAAHLGGSLEFEHPCAYSIDFGSVDHQVLRATKMTAPPPDLAALANRSCQKLGKVALLCILEQDQMRTLLPSSNDPPTTQGDRD